MDFLNTLSFWHWFLIATFLITIEAVAPFAYFLWLGIAAIIQGIVLYFFPMTGILPIIIYSGIAAIVTLLGRHFVPFHHVDKGEENINRASDRLIGKVVTLSAPIINGKAQIKVGSSVWLASGPDMDEGTVVKIVDVENNLLIVQPFQE